MNAITHHSDFFRKLDLLQLCFLLNFYFLMFLWQFPSMFPFLTYSQSFIFLSADYPRHPRGRRSKILIHLIKGKVSGVQPAVSNGGTRGTMQGEVEGREEGRIG